MRIFLSGPMGSGKSTAAPTLAEGLGLPWLDLDALVEREAGLPVSRVFAELGEGAFRALERQVLGRELERGGDFIMALGGGTVVDDESRARLLEAGLVVTLRASATELSRRLQGDASRPLLAGPEGRVRRLEALITSRAHAYAECHLTWDTERAGELLPAVRDCLASPPILVPLGVRSYAVRIGRGWLERLVLPANASSALVVTDTNVDSLWGQVVVQRLNATGHSASSVVLQAGEAHKNIGAVERIWDAALSARVDRDSVVVGVGGGVVTDLAAFAGSTLLRGLRVLLAPTSLLAMVDAAVGGKTGFDRGGGKNLIGSFWQPSGVYADVASLATLPVSERVGGLAEAVKSAWLDSEQALVELESEASALAAGDSAALEKVVRRSVRLKAHIVAGDEREAGARALLNLGHTLGHAFEAAAGFGVLGHGPAVALGMLAACRVEQRLAGASVQAEERLAHLFERLGLPTDWQARVDAKALDLLKVDKKRAAETLRFVFPGAPGRARVERVALSDLLRAVVDGVGA